MNDYFHKNIDKEIPDIQRFVFKCICLGFKTQFIINHIRAGYTYFVYARHMTVGPFHIICKKQDIFGFDPAFRKYLGINKISMTGMDREAII